MTTQHCNICHADSPADQLQRAQVRSNVRKFREEAFALWRCPACQSIHASDEVDLAHYYADYPFHHLGGSGLDWMLRAMYGQLLKRLRAAGFATGQSVLDFGCGSGLFLQFLADHDQGELCGYDEYSEKYGDPAVLERQYDLVLSQDVVEHVAEPWAHLRQLDGLVRPGGLIAVGTPNAEAIDLDAPETRVHTLHQPYHRHILSKTALLGVGDELGWELVKYHPTMYSNTALPFVNAPFLVHYFRCFDDTLDLAVEPIRAGSWRLWSPVTAWHALFGSLYAPETDVMAIFRKRPA